jgi:V8-like Glu-specific endopeptidase
MNKVTVFLVFFVAAISFSHLHAEEASQSNDAVEILEPPTQYNYDEIPPIDTPTSLKYSAESFDKDMIDALSKQPDYSNTSGASSDAEVGSGIEKPIYFSKSQEPQPEQNLYESGPEGGVPFSTARADLHNFPTNRLYPYRATGRLVAFNRDRQKRLVPAGYCSASLIKRGIIVTAAHCVTDFGKRNGYAQYEFYPGYRNGIASFETWIADHVGVNWDYLQGKIEKCEEPGIICESDIAIISLSPHLGMGGKRYYAGDLVGWYNYGYKKWGFTSKNITHVTQLGYHGGQIMQRTDTQAVISPGKSRNTVFGSLMCKGASGGPVIVNFGVRPQLTSTIPGLHAFPNVVIGVNSWHTTTSGHNIWGASPFTKENFLDLLNDVCRRKPEACR